MTKAQRAGEIHLYTNAIGEILELSSLAAARLNVTMAGAVRRLLHTYFADRHDIFRAMDLALAGEVRTHVNTLRAHGRKSQTVRVVIEKRKDRLRWTITPLA